VIEDGEEPGHRCQRRVVGVGKLAVGVEISEQIVELHPDVSQACERVNAGIDVEERRRGQVTVAE
jgi:hypothetical protein